MVRSCCAPGCTQRDTASARRNNITFHRFPLKNSVKLEKWLHAVHRQDYKNGVPWTPNGNSCLCSAHFTQDCFDRTGQTVRLRDHAVPSVFSNGSQKKTPTFHIKYLSSSYQENGSISQPAISLDCPSSQRRTTYLQDHLYHLPSNSMERKTKENSEMLDYSWADGLETPLTMSIAEGECHSSSRFPELTPGQLRLYCHKLCPFSHRTRLVMEHKRIRYETVNINLQSKPDWFLQRNPLGLVPVLEQDDKIIYESLVCNDYLNEVYPNPPLQPADPYLRAKDKMLIGQFDKDIRTALRLISNGCQKAEINQKLIYHSQMLEKELVMRGDYFGGVQVGMLDFNLWPWFERLEAFETLGECLKGFISNLPTKLSLWKNRMFQEPAVQATMFNLQQHVEFLKSLLTENEILI